MPVYKAPDMTIDEFIHITDKIQEIGARLVEAGLSDEFVESTSVMQELLDQEGEQVTLHEHEENNRIIIIQKKVGEQ